MSSIDISILVPTRKRPDWLRRLYDSVMATAEASEAVEVVCYIDDDDSSYDDIDLPRLVKVRGPRGTMSDLWNRCWKQAHGSYFGMMGDDVIFRTPGWDRLVVEGIDAHKVKIAYVYGYDDVECYYTPTFGTHGFVHANWANTLGRVFPPYFSSDYCDTWLNDVADMIHCKSHINIVTEHMHHSRGKAEVDATYAENIERHVVDNVERIYAEKLPERQEDARKLRTFIATSTS